MGEAKFLLETEAVRLLAASGIGYPDYGVAQSEWEAAEIAETIGCPVVLKIVSPQIVHKSDAGGVKVGLNGREEVIAAYRSIMNSAGIYCPEAEIKGMIVARQAPKGQEVIIGMINDDIFGKTLMFGMGGIFAELLNDVTFRVCPVDRENAESMIRETRMAKLLDGYRGAAGLDTEALADLLVKVSDMAVKNGDIGGLDLNPVVVYEKGLMVLDARVMVGN